MHDIDLDEISRRPLRIINADGIFELAMGAVWLLWGILTGIPELIPKDQLWRPYWMIVPFVLASSGLASPWVVRKLKERFSYPRAGYVELRPPKGGRLWALVFVALITGFVAAAFVTKSKTWLDQLPVICTAVIAVAMHFVLRKQASSGAYVYPLLCLAFGAVGVVANLESGAAFAVLYTGLGVAMSIGGGIRLIRFVRRHKEFNG